MSDCNKKAVSHDRDTAFSHDSWLIETDRQYLIASATSKTSDLTPVVSSSPLL